MGLRQGLTQPFFYMLLTVVIPAYRNVALLRRCLRSLADVGADCDMQVVVVDDGSEPSEADAMSQLPEVAELQALLLHRPHGGASAARNAGIAEARGRFVWFVDADDRVDTDALRRWLPRLAQLPDEADLLHTGPMLDAAATRRRDDEGDTGIASVAASALLRPRSACLDHTTYLIARRLLQEQPALRYPEEHSLLEDSAFVLQLLQAARSIYEAPAFRPYIRCRDAASLTAGPWDRQRCQRLLPDIHWFLSLLHAFVVAHADWPHADALFRRYAYLYLRVVAVKGCPWPLMAPLRAQLLADGFRPCSLKERVVCFPPTLRMVSSLSRLLR